MSATEPTHAGGVVVRDAASGPEILLVTARRSPDEWVLPKGHIDPGETAEETAVREIAEEAGVEARVVRALGVAEWTQGAAVIRTVYFLMDEVGVVPPSEQRQVAWVSPAEATRRLRWASARRLIGLATDAPRC